MSTGNKVYRWLQWPYSFFPFVCSRHFSQEDQQHDIKRTSGAAADPCSLLLKMGKLDEGPRMAGREEILFIIYYVQAKWAGGMDDS